jgi:hypothetical protein
MTQQARFGARSDLRLPAGQCHGMFEFMLNMMAPLA